MIGCRKEDLKHSQMQHQSDTSSISIDTQSSESFQFSKSEIKKLFFKFRSLDKNQNGCLEKEEFLSLEGINRNPLASRLMELFDTDRSGEVSFEEFLNGLSVFSSRGNKKTKLKFVFDVYDLDGDGFISNAELFMTLQMMVGPNLQQEQLQQIVDKTFLEADLDKDGRVSFDEFVTIVERKSPDLAEKLTFADF